MHTVFFRSSVCICSAVLPQWPPCSRPGNKWPTALLHRAAAVAALLPAGEQVARTALDRRCPEVPAIDHDRRLHRSR